MQRLLSDVDMFDIVFAHYVRGRVYESRSLGHDAFIAYSELIDEDYDIILAILNRECLIPTDKILKDMSIVPMLSGYKIDE